ncbi:MAG: DUF6311 domain-containing protein [Roseburia sp.]|nr:DUF6311 domain-containing protein [Roseburia sp.]
MRIKRFLWGEKAALSMSALLGAGIFVLIYGINVLNPCYVDWLMSRTDLAQHYLGWCFYRAGDWTFPIGLTDRLAYPTETSIIFTDSVPLFAVLFKLLDPILPTPFQYFGWWGLLCFMLQGWFAAKLLQECSVGKLQTVVGSVFFVLSPTVIEKMFRHTALGGHWIILASIYLFMKHKKMYDGKRADMVWWGIVGALTASIHLYYLPMCGMFLGGYTLCSILRERRLRIKYLLPGAAFVAGVFAAVYILGGFSTPASAEAEGLGEYSFNLNGFFNSKGYSRILEPLPTYRDGQYEGFAYLGLGVFILLLSGIVYIIVSIIRGSVAKSRDFRLYGAVYLLMIVGLILFAASPEVSLNDRLLFQYPYSSTLYHYWSIFRSSGRMIWPVCYLLYIGGIVGNDRLWKRAKGKERLASAVLVLCVLAQAFDLSDKLAEQKGNFDRIVYESPLQAEIWERLATVETIEHVVWVSNNFEPDEIVHIAKYADSNRWTMNNFYFARGISVRENTKQSMRSLNNTCIYIFSAEEPTDYELYLYEAGSYTIGTTFPVFISASLE